MNPNQTIVKILDESNKFLGTGFFVSPIQILTCRHVIDKNLDSHNIPKIKIGWLGETRKVHDFKFHKSRDAVILEIMHPFSIEPYILHWADYTASEDRQVIINGFSNPVLFESEELVRVIRGYSPDYDLCILDHPVDLGFSGSPARIDNMFIGLTVAADSSRTFLIPVTALTSFRPNDKNNISDNCILDVGAIKPVPDWGSPAEVKFTLTNTSNKICKISSIYLDVLRRNTINEPHHFFPGAIVVEYELNIHINPNEDHYELIESPHILKPGETDGFRIKIDSDDGWEYSIVIKVVVNNLGNKIKDELVIGPFDLIFRLRSSTSLLKAIREAKQSKM